MFSGYFEPEMIDGDLSFYITHYVIITFSARTSTRHNFFSSTFLKYRQIFLESQDFILSFEGGFSPEAIGSKKLSTLFPLKFDFRQKFMVFQKIFFAQIEEL